MPSKLELPFYVAVTLCVPNPHFPAFSTTCFVLFDVLPPKFESPAQTALTDVVPTLSVEVGSPSGVSSRSAPVPLTCFR